MLTPVWMRYILNDDNVDRFVNYGVNVFGISSDKKPYEIAELAIQKTEEVFEKMGLKLSMQDLELRTKATLRVWQSVPRMDLMSARFRSIKTRLKKFTVNV